MMSMMTDEQCQEITAHLCLRVVAEPDPSALSRVLAQFQHLNIVPWRVLAERCSDSTVYIRIDIAGLSEDRLSLIAAKIGQIPAVVRSYWHRI
jgi:hypothetical protein